MAKKSRKPDKKVSYEQLGRMLESIYDSGYIDKNRMYRMSFVKGVLAGFGGVIGATIVVGALLWVLSLFDNVWFLNNVTNTIENSIQKEPSK